MGKIPVLDENIIELLDALYAGYREHLAGIMQHGDGNAVTGYNAKGDRQRRFDVLIDKWVRDWLIRRGVDGVVLSEELDDVEFGVAAGGHCFVVDPVDGSENYARGLPLAALSIAVLPRSAPLAPKSVVHAVVGDLAESTPILASRGNGAHQCGRRLETSGVRKLRDAVVSFELNHWSPDRALADTLHACAGVRTYGCASRAMCLVATGALDAHVDVRRRLTPESFLAAALVVVEAGGQVVQLDGSPLGPFDGLRDRTTLIAAATPDLVEEIINAIVV
ncbi:MAG: inositol monophosphatase family protein [Candidatus Krumholzibacteria bacterium]